MKDEKRRDFLAKNIDLPDVRDKIDELVDEGRREMMTIALEMVFVVAAVVIVVLTNNTSMFTGVVMGVGWFVSLALRAHERKLRHDYQVSYLIERGARRGEVSEPQED